MSTIGIIGGSGVYDLDGLRSIEEVEVDTPFGRPSDRLVCGELAGQRLVFIPRHGKGHRWLPSEVPYHANIFALKSLGVEWLISVSAVGSMQEAIQPGHFVLPDQYIDRTVSRRPTFFGEGVVAHVSVADPTCEPLRRVLATATAQVGVTCHQGGTYVCIEGPAFSTRAESLMYRGMGVSVIGMTAMPEVKLAREAELHYATIALSTDYDCWHESEDDVSAHAVIEILRQNSAKVRDVLRSVIPAVGRLDGAGCRCQSALAGGIMTHRDLIPAAHKSRLEPLLKKYL